jgi:3',5'-cyclic AMP phosphodiesterase CpdA
VRIAHLSDIHFGRIAYPEIVGLLVGEVNAAEVDLVAVSGDLTQRARRHQFTAAVEMLKSFEAPVLVVPGNHDVYPWWRPISRLAFPLGRYKRYVSRDLLPTFEMEGLSVLGINSAHGRTVKGGQIRKREREAIREFFSSRDASIFKVLVVHHHITRIQALGPHDVVSQAREALEVASASGVDLILCGHLHVSHVEPLSVVPENHRIVVVSAGTATSNRGRGTNRHTNFYNVIEIDDEAFTIEERKFDPEARRFVTHATTRFARLPETQETLKQGEQ